MNLMNLFSGWDAFVGLSSEFIVIVITISSGGFLSSRRASRIFVPASSVAIGCQNIVS